MDQLKALVEAIEGSVGAVDVHSDTGAPRLIPDALEPGREHPERLVANEEARYEENRRAVAMRHAHAAVEGVDE